MDQSSQSRPSMGDRLETCVRRSGTPLVVGLDPRSDLLPGGLGSARSDRDYERRARCVAQFCRDVIDVVSSLVSIVKPQAAFFECLGPHGWQALADVITYARERKLFVILDGKRNDIGPTAEGYAEAYLHADSPLPVDALTVNPYLGVDGLRPFVIAGRSHGTGIFVLVKTSNASSGQIQDLVTDGKPIHHHVAEILNGLNDETVATSRFGSIGAVVGATYPEQLNELRSAMPQTWLLVPGLGAQGGSAADVSGAFLPDGTGACVNSSRGIIFAYRDEPYRDRYDHAGWQRAVEDATRDTIQRLRDATPASQLR